MQLFRAGNERRLSRRGITISQGHTEPLVLSYLALRKAVGWIGLSIPFVLVIGGWIFQALAHEPRHIEFSISAYYYTHMGSVFVGLLCAIGVFHLATEGYDRWDRIAGRLACVFAVGVAWIPTTRPGVNCNANPILSQCILGYVHYTFAALLFFTLAFFCLRQFTQTDDLRTRTHRKKQRNAIYYVCGSTILACIAVIGIVKIVSLCGVLVPFRIWLDSWKWNFWFESLALIAFGTAFLIKGEFILKDQGRSHPAAHSSAQPGALWH